MLREVEAEETELEQKAMNKLQQMKTTLQQKQSQITSQLQNQALTPPQVQALHGTFFFLAATIFFLLFNPCLDVARRLFISKLEFFFNSLVL